MTKNIQFEENFAQFYLLDIVYYQFTVDSFICKSIGQYQISGMIFDYIWLGYLTTGSSGICGGISDVHSFKIWRQIMRLDEEVEAEPGSLGQGSHERAGKTQQNGAN